MATMATEAPPHPVLAVFGLDGKRLEPVESGDAWRAGNTVLHPVEDTNRVAWEGKALTTIALPNTTIMTPMRSRDGRLAVGGWAAYRTGDDDADASRPTVDHIVKLGAELHRATANFARPSFVDTSTDAFARADRMAWGEEDPDALDERRGGRWFAILSGSLQPVDLPEQVIHPNLYAGVRVAHGHMTIAGFRPLYRPAEWATALVVVDAVVADEGGSELMSRWAQTQSWRQLLLRAILYRLAEHALTPEAGDDELEELRRTGALISDYR